MTVYYEFEVELIGVEPRVWRRFLLKDTLSFNSLHNAIQDACQWCNYHLFEFTSGHGYDRKTIVVSPHFEDDISGEEHIPAGKLKLRSFFKLNSECTYIYDFGDSWLHSVKLLGLHEKDSNNKRELIAGARAFPLEDSGGLPGYEECVKAFRTTVEGDEDLDSRKEWIGDWNPDLFDFDETKKSFDR